MGSHASHALRLSFTLSVAFSVCTLCAPAWADSEADAKSEGNRDGLGLEVHGFVSQGFLKSTSNNYLANSERGSFEFTEVGINFSKQLTERMRVGMQLFTHDLGPLGNYRTRFDWFYLDYRFWDWLGVRAGRTKVPFGLYNESSDVDAARVPVLLPQSVYPASNRDLLLAQTGGEVYGDIQLGKAGSLEYRLYGGTIFFDTADTASTASNVSVPFIVGGRLMWQAPLEGLQMGASVQKLRLDADLVLPPEQVEGLKAAGSIPSDFKGSLKLQIPALLGVASLEYSAHDLLLASEYSRWQVGLNSALAAFSTPDTVSERFYVMAAYHLTSWFTPGLYYSVLFTDVADRRGHRPPVGALPGAPGLGRGAYQHDLGLTLRYDLNAYWLLKVEGHFMHGTAALTSALNDNQPLSALTKDWGVLLLKTTAYF